MEIVNGYACLNCSEAALAKRNIDPAKGLQGTRTEEIQRAQERKAIDELRSDGARGRQINLTA
jgi:hypothetical protein